MRAYLTKQANGQYSLTKKLPIICKVDGTDHEDVYPAPGDSIGKRDYCDLVLPFFGVRDLVPLEPVEVEIVGRLIE